MGKVILDRNLFLKYNDCKVIFKKTLSRVLRVTFQFPVRFNNVARFKCNLTYKYPIMMI